ncbi:DUF6417 family protein [Streptomyces sp. NPDC055722]
MDGGDHVDVDGIGFAPVGCSTEGLALLFLEEARELLRLLVAVAQDGGLMSAAADRLARKIAARVPSES